MLELWRLNLHNEEERRSHAQSEETGEGDASVLQDAERDSGVLASHDLYNTESDDEHAEDDE